MYFRYFFIISPRKRAWNSIWINLNPLPSLDETSQVVLEKKISINFVNVFPYFVIISPWKSVWPFLWTNLYPLQDALCQVWLKLAQRVLRRRFLIFVFPWLSPLGKGRGPLFKQNWISFTWGCFEPSLVEISTVVLEKMKMWKA